MITHLVRTSAKPAVVLHPSGTTVTFAQLKGRANRLAHLLRRAGLKVGDIVAILMENNGHIHAAMWAARRSGLYYTLVNTRLSAREIDYIIHDSGAKAVIASHDGAAGHRDRMRPNPLSESRDAARRPST